MGKVFSFEWLGGKKKKKRLCDISFKSSLETDLVFRRKLN